MIQNDVEQKHHDALREKDQMIEQQTKIIAEKDRIIGDKDEEITYLREQLATSLKNPRTVNNDNRNMGNRYVVNQNIRVFGKEDTSHISGEQWRRLISQPDTAVADLCRLVHSVPENQNVRLPNKRERRYEVVVAEEGENGAKRWKSVDKQEVLSDMFERNEMLIEAQLDEDDGGPGSRFVRYHDKVRDSIDGEDGGKLFQEQLNRLHMNFCDSS